MNNGNKQATIAYKQTPNGQAVDVDGQLTSISGKRQAIALLNGATNPDPALYEVEFYFGPGDTVTGNPTTDTDLGYCPVSMFTIDKNYIVLHPGKVNDLINIYASFGWQLDSAVNFITVVPNMGAGSVVTSVTLSRTSTVGQGIVNFKDNATGQIKGVYVVNTDALGWILETGSWNSLRFWEATGIWNY